MTLQVVNHPRLADRETMLKVLDALREHVESGELICFTAVGINEDDETYVFAASERHVSVLRQVGAVSHLLYGLNSGEI